MFRLEYWVVGCYLYVEISPKNTFRDNYLYNLHCNLEELGLLYTNGTLVMLVMMIQNYVWYVFRYWVLVIVIL